MYRTPNGTFDPNFDGDGVASVTTTVPGNQSVVDAAVLPDDGMLVLGVGDDGSGTVKPMITRMTPSGAIDTSYGTSGTAWLSGVDLTGFMTSPRLLRLTSGQLIVAGVADGNAGAELWIRRLNADGSVDTAFGTGGTTTFDIDTFAMVNTIDVDPSGRIVVTGRSWKSGPETMLVRLTAGGTKDVAFGVNGITWFHCGDFQHGIAGAVIGSDGRIFTLGDYTAGAGRPAYVAATLPNGALDPAFGTGGCLAVPGIAGPSSLEADSQGRLIVGLSDTVARLIPTNPGSWDASFGVGGFTTLPSNVGGLRVAVQPDDGVIAFGQYYFTYSVRLRPNGTPDPGFGTAGVSQVPGSPDSQGLAVVTASDGRATAIYVYGNSPNRPIGMARLATTAVTSYGPGQTWTTGGASGVFAACLRNATLGASTGAGTWVSRGGPACTAADADPWMPVVAGPGDAGALVARTSVSQTEGARVDLQFGFRASATQLPGSYVAPVTFDVIAP